LDKNIPGPGNYNYAKPLGTDALKFSLFGRRGGTVMFDKILKNPGPGEYDHINIKGSGKYPISSFRNTTNSINWSNEKLNRFFQFSKFYCSNKIYQLYMIKNLKINFIYQKTIFLVQLNINRKIK
jgi:hypothetical protein